jgi:hypothetical protein
LARLEHQALGRRHFTVLDTLLRLRRRFLHSARMQVVRVE